MDPAREYFDMIDRLQPQIQAARDAQAHIASMVPDVEETARLFEEEVRLARLRQMEMADAVAALGQYSLPIERYASTKKPRVDSDTRVQVLVAENASLVAENEKLRNENRALRTARQAQRSLTKFHNWFTETLEYGRPTTGR